MTELTPDAEAEADGAVIDGAVIDGAVIDGAVIDSAELAALVRRTAAELPALFAGIDQERGKQLDAVVALLESVALRLVTAPPSEAARAELSRALDGDDEVHALATARRIARSELARMTVRDWGLFA